MGGLFSSHVVDEEAARRVGPQCEGCEKEVASEDQLTVHLGKKYCQDCTKAIKGNQRRTMQNLMQTDQQIMEQLHSEIAQADAMQASGVVPGNDPSITNLTLKAEGDERNDEEPATEANIRVEVNQ
eukprot:TRINITY_DN3149_c0_g1_i2.p1 TRINITY_DN3149_c0_g1~~TRINITY_DN3149_c0_g1_i2.p1  ORF type:complete len:126 (-),score=45.92 TRINITY_DN3149_c0_g1_i2:56-433(-)